MDNIEFVDQGESEIGVHIIINGRELVDIVREVELPLATKEGRPELAGQYSYFGPMFVFSPARHFYGEPEHDWTDGEGRIYILGCTCGIPGCWALSARVELGEAHVTWSDFRQIHRGAAAPAGEWRYDALGPFTFDRQRYDQELSKLPVSPKPKPRTRNTELTEIFNLGFRRGANDRAAAGVPVTTNSSHRPIIPNLPEQYRDEVERKAWIEGYRAGHECGASDAELASVDIPGAHGMISGYDQDFLERYGFIKRILSETDKADGKAQDGP